MSLATPETNPIHNAIDALHAAFVGAPAEDAGTPIDFAQDTPEAQPEPAPEPDSERKPLTIEEAILRECPGMGASAQAISYATGMKEEHVVLAAEASPLLTFPYGRRGATGIAFCNIIRATEAGRARAAELGWMDAADPDPEVPEHIKEGMDAQADAEAKAKGFRDDAERQRLLEEARRQEEAEFAPYVQANGTAHIQGTEPIAPPYAVPCSRCELFTRFAGIGEDGLCEDCAVDAQEQEATRIQGMRAGQPGGALGHRGPSGGQAPEPGGDAPANRSPGGHLRQAAEGDRDPPGRDGRSRVGLHPGLRLPGEPPLLPRGVPQLRGPRDPEGSEGEPGGPPGPHRVPPPGDLHAAGGCSPDAGPGQRVHQGRLLEPDQGVDGPIPAHRLDGRPLHAHRRGARGRPHLPERLRPDRPGPVGPQPNPSPLGATEALGGPSYRRPR